MWDNQKKEISFSFVDYKCLSFKYYSFNFLILKYGNIPTIGYICLVGAVFEISVIDSDDEAVTITIGMTFSCKTFLNFEG